MKRKIVYKLENTRQCFFGYNPIGEKILSTVERLHARFPKNGVITKLWNFCLPF